MNLKQVMAVGAVVGGVGCCLAGCGHHVQTVTSKQESVQNSIAASQAAQQSSLKAAQKHAQAEQKAMENSLQTKLSAMNYQSGTSPVVAINHSQAGLKPKNWQRPGIFYGGVDQQGRAVHLTTAFFNQAHYQANATPYHYDEHDVPGWHDNNQQVVQPLIPAMFAHGFNAHGQVSEQTKAPAARDNQYLATTFASQKLISHYTQQIQQALQNGQQVSYQIMPIYHGKDLMSKGVWMQAAGNHGLNFNVYIYNVQPGWQYNYQTGTGHADPNMKVPEPRN